MQMLYPVQTKEREVFMDVLRGFAILGIFIANLDSFNFFNEQAHATGPFLLQEWDHKMLLLHHMFVEGKFYSIFSLLFGWGIALQVKRGLENGINPIPTIKRRLGFMLVLGFAHLMIWFGDIVLFYALLGFVLLPLRRFSNKILLVTGAILILLPILLYAAKMKWPWLNAPADFLFKTGQKLDTKLLDTKLLGTTLEARYAFLEKNAGWWDIFKGNLSGIFYRYGYLLFVSRIPKVLGMFLVG